MIVGTSSLRRAAQVLARSPDVAIRALRGNVPTRIGKLRDGEYDAILLASAGVSRLGLDLGGLVAYELPYESMLPAPGQGALAIETRSEDPRTGDLNRLHDRRLASCIEAERTLLELLGGGCHLPLGCLATEEAAGIRLQAVLGDIDDEATAATVARVAGAAPDPVTAARVCYEALRHAMPEVVQP
jgi:hydroxymethylbilane synthase